MRRPFFARCEPRGRADRVVRPYMVQCKSIGEYVTRCHLHRRRFASVFAWQLASLGDLLPYRRRVVRCGKVTFVCWPERLILVLAVVLRQECTPRLQRLFSPHSFLARQKRMGRRRHVCGVTASYRMPVHADNPSVKTCGFATSPYTGEALGRTESSAPFLTNSNALRLCLRAFVISFAPAKWDAAASDTARANSRHPAPDVSQCRACAGSNGAYASPPG